MAYPTQREIELPLLQAIDQLGGEAKPKDLYERLADHFGLTEQERTERLETGPVKWWNAVQWARQTLVVRGDVDGSTRGIWKLTDAGTHRIREEGGTVSVSKRGASRVGSVPAVADQAPAETISIAYRTLRDALAAELLQTVRQCSPAFFEQLVIDLLVRMGYGGSRSEAGQAIGKSGDEGIDGIINEDRLGLDSVYVQAKRWKETTPVGRPDIQQFAGALAGRRAKKGVFITTASFTRDATDYASKIDPKIVLIDGTRLASLMIDFGVGVTAVASYEIKRIDGDYFGDETL
jgi:restriction system protein